MNITEGAFPLCNIKGFSERSERKGTGYRILQIEKLRIVFLRLQI